MTEDNCSMTDISKLILNKHKIMSGKYFTRQQLMDCIVSQQERISKLREALEFFIDTNDHINGCKHPFGA